LSFIDGLLLTTRLFYILYSMCALYVMPSEEPPPTLHLLLLAKAKMWGSTKQPKILKFRFFCILLLPLFFGLLLHIQVIAELLSALSLPTEKSRIKQQQQQQQQQQRQKERASFFFSCS